ncbi:MAG: hypothetical protein AAGH15_21760 [Myxococcota bacterium]
MPTQYVDTDDFDAVVQASVRELLFDDSSSEDGSGYSSDLFNRAAQHASVMVRAAAKNAGYGVDDDTSDEMLQLAALSVLVRFAYGRKQQEVPPDLLDLFGAIPEALRVGDLPLTDTAPDAASGIGGVEFTPSSTTSTSTRARPARLNGLRKLV